MCPIRIEPDKYNVYVRSIMSGQTNEMYSLVYRKSANYKGALVDEVLKDIRGKGVKKQKLNPVASTSTSTSSVAKIDNPSYFQLGNKYIFVPKLEELQLRLVYANGKGVPSYSGQPISQSLKQDFISVLSQIPSPHTSCLFIIVLLFVSLVFGLFGGEFFLYLKKFRF